MALLLTTWLKDPLLVKEFRTRMRARTVLIVEVVYMVAISAVVAMGFLFADDARRTPGWEVGSGLFKTITYFQAILMFFVSPLVTAAAVSGEKEQKTFDSLSVTPVSPRRIVLCKLSAALSCFLVLIGVSLPFTCASFILGGVAPGDLGHAYLYTILSTSMIGAIGIYWSTRFERSIASIPAAAVTAVAFLMYCGMLDNMNMSALATLSPLVFLNRLYSGAPIPFFGLSCPAWAPSSWFTALVFAYFLTSASIRMHFPGERRYVLHRFLALLFLASVFVFMMGQIAVPAMEAPDARRRIVGALILSCVALTLIGIWVGANTAVLSSGARSGVSRGARRLVAVLLTRPWWFMLLVLLAGAPSLAMASGIVGATNIPTPVLWLAYFGLVGLSVQTWLLLSARLACGGTRRRRFGGLAVTCLIMALVMLLPFAAAWIAGARTPGRVPDPLQYASLLSPLSSLMGLFDPFQSQQPLSAVLARFGRWGPAVITSCVYLAATLALFLFRPRPDRAGPRPAHNIL